MFTDSKKQLNRNQNRSTVACQNGIVCSEQPLAVMAGIDILKAGGNAIDAAVCANAMLSLVSPMMCGPGGDLFAIIWNQAEQKLLGLNASGRSPYNWNLNDAKAMGIDYIPEFSPLAWTVPGCLSGWKALLEKMGTFDIATLLQAPIEYSRKGFPVSPLIAWERMLSEMDDIKNMAPTFRPDGKAVKFGDIFKNQDLGDFFEIIAKEGIDSFYKGQIAERIVKFSDAQGGKLSIADFNDHTANWIDPVSSNYRGYDVWEIPPSGQGIAALQILNLLEHFDIGSLKPNSAEQLHLFLEAKKLAFEDRAVYYADMDFANVPLKQLISKEYAAQRVKLIDPNRAAAKVAPGRINSPSDTTYVTVADKEGNMISLIQSIYHGGGSRFVPDSLGFCLQNRGLAFSLNPNALNKLEPHKRPFHTIIPGFVTKENQPVFSFGVVGADFQTQGHAQILMNIIDFGMDPQQAGEQPRVQHSESSSFTGTKIASAGTVALEPNIPESVKQKLTEMGHKIDPETAAFGGYHGIWRQPTPRRYFGASDPRRDGCAIGY